MVEFIKYFALWLFFMGLIAAITILVPKIAKAADKKIAKIKEKNNGKPGLANLSDEVIMPENMPDSAEETATAEQESNEK